MATKLDNFINDITSDLDGYETFEEKDDFLRTADFGMGRTIHDFYTNPDFDGLKEYLQGYMFDTAKKQFGAGEGYTIGTVSDNDVLEHINRIELNTKFLKEIDPLELETIKNSYKEYSEKYNAYNADITRLITEIKSKDAIWEEDAIYGGNLMFKYPLPLSDDPEYKESEFYDPDITEHKYSGYEMKKRYDLSSLFGIPKSEILTRFKVQGVDSHSPQQQQAIYSMIAMGIMDESGDITPEYEHIFDLEGTVPYPEHMSSFDRWVRTGDSEATESGPGRYSFDKDMPKIPEYSKIRGRSKVFASNDVFDPNYTRTANKWEKRYLDPASDDYDIKMAKYHEMTEGFTIKGGVAHGRFVRGVTGILGGREEGSSDWIARNAHPFGVAAKVGATAWKALDWVNPLSWGQWFLDRDASETAGLSLGANWRKSTDYNDVLGMSYQDYYSDQINPISEILEDTYVKRDSLAIEYKDAINEYEDWEDLVQGNKDRFDVINSTALDEILQSEAFSKDDKWTTEDYNAFEKLLMGE